MSNNKQIRVMLADDHPVVMRGFSLALGDFDIEVVGQAKNPEEAIGMYEELLPDVVILDIRFGSTMTGIDAGKAILGKHPDSKVIFLSQFDQVALIQESYRIGGKAFMTKSCNPSELADAVKMASQGKVYFMPEIAQKLAGLSVGGDDSPQSKLEPREIEIFTLMAKGLTNAEIAERLGLSTKTISNTSQSIKERLGVQRAADITILAIKYGLIVPEIN